MVNVEILNNENSLDRFISDKKMLYLKRSRLKTLLGGWMDGWMGGWVAGKAGLRTAYSNQKSNWDLSGCRDNEADATYFFLKNLYSQTRKKNFVSKMFRRQSFAQISMLL
jgi:hypothetical protein